MKFSMKFPVKFSVFHHQAHHRLPLLAALILLGCSPNTQAAQDQATQDKRVAPSTTSQPTIAKTESQAEPKEPKTEPSVNVQSDAPSATTIDRVTLMAKTAKFVWRRPESDPKSTSRSDLRDADLRYPTVTGLADSGLKTKIQTAIDLKSAFGKSLQEMETEYQENHWMEKLDYEVNYNQSGLLSLTYSGYGTGAYPSGFVRYRSVNLHNGEVLRAHDLFKTEGLGAIALMVDRQLQQAIQTKVAELDKDDNAKDIDRAIFRAHRFRIKHLNEFTITPEGIIFHYRFGFPHVILAAEPKGDYLIPYADLKSHLRANSPLLRIH
jgi:hypothetical protein